MHARVAHGIPEDQERLFGQRIGRHIGAAGACYVARLLAGAKTLDHRLIEGRQLARRLDNQQLATSQRRGRSRHGLAGLQSAEDVEVRVENHRCRRHIERYLDVRDRLVDLDDHILVRAVIADDS